MNKIAAMKLSKIKLTMLRVLNNFLACFVSPFPISLPMRTQAVWSRPCPI